MPVSKNQGTTSKTDPVAREQVGAQKPDQQAFHEHLRALTRDAVRAYQRTLQRQEMSPNGSFSSKRADKLHQFRGRPSITRRGGIACGWNDISFPSLHALLLSLQYLTFFSRPIRQHYLSVALPPECLLAQVLVKGLY